MKDSVYLTELERQVLDVFIKNKIYIDAHISNSLETLISKLEAYNEEEIEMQNQRVARPQKPL